MTVSAQGSTRVRFRDVKPYDAPASLDDLRGPRDGELVLPHHIHWGPRRDVNLSRKGDVLTAYQATISEGMVADQASILNRSLLLELWPELILSNRVRSWAALAELDVQGDRETFNRRLIDTALAPCSSSA